MVSTKQQVVFHLAWKKHFSFKRIESAYALDSIKSGLHIQSTQILSKRQLSNSKHNLADGREPSTTSQERQKPRHEHPKPRHEHPKPNQERLGLREERLGQRGGASSSRWRASRLMKGASRIKLLSPWPSESMQISLCYMKAH